jgi:hypothetical protein
MVEKNAQQGLLSGGGGEEQRTAADGSEGNVTPEEQEAYDRVVMAAQSIIYDEEQSQNIVKMLKKNPANPGEAVGDTTAMLIQQIDEKSGGQIPEEVILPAAFEVMSDLIEMGEESGALDMGGEQDYVSAWHATVGQVMTAYGATQEDIETLMAEYGEDDVMGEAVNAQFQTHANDGTPSARTSLDPMQPVQEEAPMPTQGGGLPQ